MARTFVLVLSANGGGAILNVESILALAPMQALTGYCASEAAAHALTIALRAQVSQKQVTVHSLLSGPIDPDMVAALDWPKTSPREVARAALEGVEAGDEIILPDAFATESYKMWSTDPIATKPQEAGQEITAMAHTATISPVGAVTLGAAAGAVGTAAMDSLWFWRYRRDGGQQGAVAWETAEGVDKWYDASAPGQVGRRLVEGFTGRELPDRWARAMTNAVHWGTGLAWGAQFGLLAGSTKRRHWTLGLLLGPAVWLAAYVLLPFAKLYKPMWEYDAKTLAKDLSAHLVYGAATGASFAALTR